MAGKRRKTLAKNLTFRLRVLKSPLYGNLLVSVSFFCLTPLARLDSILRLENVATPSWRRSYVCSYLLAFLSIFSPEVMFGLGHLDAYLQGLLVVFVFSFPSSSHYGMVAGSGDTRSKKLHILGRMPLTWHRDPWECLLMLGETLVIKLLILWIYFYKWTRGMMRGSEMWI